MFYLIHWLNENLWDVWEDEEANERIPQELRFEGALGLMQYTDGQSYLGKVLKMSEDKDEVEKAEQELSGLIKSQKTAPVEPRNRKRNTKSRSKSTTVATERQVSSALNERPKLTPAQLEVKKRAAEQLKLKAAAQQKEEDRQDKNLQKSVSRALDFGKSNSDALSDEDIFSNPESDDDVDLEPGNLAVQDNTKKHDNDSLKSSDEEGDPEIGNFKNPITVNFLHFLLKKFGSSPTYQVSDGQNVAQPQEIPGHKMVHLIKGHALKIHKGGRNVLIVDSKSHKKPSLFARKTIVQLYGEKQLASLTVKGRKKGSIRISDKDLAAIYEFVVEYTKPKKFSWEDFLQSLTKKISAAKSPKSSKADEEDKITPSKMNTPKKGQPTKDEERVIASPSKFQRGLTVTELPSGSSSSGLEMASSNHQATPSCHQPQVSGGPSLYHRAPCESYSMSQPGPSHTAVPQYNYQRGQQSSSYQNYFGGAGAAGPAAPTAGPSSYHNGSYYPEQSQTYTNLDNRYQGTWNNWGY